jgi:hypothetical protein
MEREEKNVRRGNEITLKALYRTHERTYLPSEKLSDLSPGPYRFVRSESLSCETTTRRRRRRKIRGGGGERGG